MIAVDTQSGKKLPLCMGRLAGFPLRWLQDFGSGQRRNCRNMASFTWQTRPRRMVERLMARKDENSCSHSNPRCDRFVNQVWVRRQRLGQPPDFWGLGCWDDFIKALT
ncbi:hypothetical protein SPLC1_S050560 [Arthrospira platensis C1]|nr:hypothetical protein SPLC1_S050560 [Arthrospira platensis C1]